jgi:hypothetical protein
MFSCFLVVVVVDDGLPNLIGTETLKRMKRKRTEVPYQLQISGSTG